jgi:outer membrane protein assembly factor BamE (lipoprotein component of BamABCDE complex)
MTLKHNIKAILFTGVLAGFSALVAEEIKIPIGQQGKGEGIIVPYKGMKQSEVREAYGEPMTVHATVGQPPITRWDYPRFSVFFEYQATIHAVIRKNKPPQQ